MKLDWIGTVLGTTRQVHGMACACVVAADLARLLLCASARYSVEPSVPQFTGADIDRGADQLACWEDKQQHLLASQFN